LLGDLPVGAVLEVETKNRSYRLESRGDGRVLISGHPRHCPEPVLVSIHGSTWGKCMLKVRFIGRGMHLEYRHPTRGVIRTSRIREIRQLPVNDGPGAYSAAKPAENDSRCGFSPNTGCDAPTKPAREGPKTLISVTGSAAQMPVRSFAQFLVTGRASLSPKPSSC
jgi:hypothetical protein